LRLKQIQAGWLKAKKQTGCDGSNESLERKGSNPTSLFESVDWGDDIEGRREKKLDEGESRNLTKTIDDSMKEK
jgi:hypothetical protein